MCVRHKQLARTSLNDESVSGVTVRRKSMYSSLWNLSICCGVARHGRGVFVCECAGVIVEEGGVVQT